MNWQQIATFIFLFFMLIFSFWAYQLANQKRASEEKKALKTKAKKR